MGIEVVDSLGIATNLLDKQGDLKPYNSWMGISTSEKTYPDDLVIEMAKWASEKSDKFLLLIADRLQLHNKVPFSTKGMDKLDSGEYIKPAIRRRDTLRELAEQRGLENIEVKLLEYEFIEGIRASGSENRFRVDYGYQIFNQTRFGSDSPLDADINDVTWKKAGNIIKKAIDSGAPEPHVVFAISGYAHDEIFASWLLAELGIANIKIGPKWEKDYDIITKNLIDGVYGRMSKDKKFGGVYLKVIRESDK